MPLIYLSPSTQEYNPYVTGGSEEEWMNRLADAMLPWLNANGIRYVRNTPDMTAASSITASNAGNYDLHLALHSNAAPESLSGTLRGILVYYYPGSTNGKRCADLIAASLRAIYPLPDLVRTESTTSIGEVRRVRAVSVFLEIGYHDNREDALWVQEHIEELARAIVHALTEYFGLPFLSPVPEGRGVVDVNWGSLNIRAAPGTSAAILKRAPDGAHLTIVNRWENWFLVRYGGVTGYASADFVTLI